MPVPIRRCGADLPEAYNNVEVTPLDGSRSGVALTGDLDMADAESVQRMLAGLAEEAAPEPVVVDLSGLAFIDSHGVRALFRARDAAERAGGRIALHPGHGRVRRTLDLVDAGSAFELLAEPPAG
jgi:anti-anti-sigma factor